MHLAANALLSHMRTIYTSILLSGQAVWTHRRRLSSSSSSSPTTLYEGGGLVFMRHTCGYMFIMCALLSHVHVEGSYYMCMIALHVRSCMNKRCSLLSLSLSVDIYQL
eukprot:GHVS01061264.1.p2 GENE.GHVS01061264.1~~GHVS01061264.1.p2  ORF type:complete len:108 (-),score=9.07 GHVS01061264.1:264-587(-)